LIPNKSEAGGGVDALLVGPPERQLLLRPATNDLTDEMSAVLLHHAP
jgi:hypothetical protein